MLEHIVPSRHHKRTLLLRQPLSTLIPSTTLSRPKIPSTNKPSQYSHELAASRTADLERRERDLESRERELQQKAETIRKRMAVITGRLVSLFRRSSASQKLSCLFLPVLLVVFPLIYHDISEEIPEASRPLIKRLYLLWLILAGTLIVNMVACIFVLTSGGSDGVKDLIISIMCVSPWAGDFLVNS